MNCPKCRAKDALQLLTSFKCINSKCENFDLTWNVEVLAKKSKKYKYKYTKGVGNRNHIYRFPFRLNPYKRFNSTKVYANRYKYKTL